ncbi:MAG TPA: ankyrin repeat domain-containing protein [Isosphaeraceae bacterium]|nr:ankyrin repeat domain-containing protein [Isosphaeraceae bacterium]
MAPAQIVVLLLAAWTPPQEASKYESAIAAALQHFAREGDVEYVEAILEKHPRLVNAPEPYRPQRKPDSTGGYTPLHWAARFGHTDLANALIRRGANVNADAGDGWTPLHLAAQSGHLQMVKELVAHGANIRAQTAAIPESSGVQPGAPPTDPAAPPEPPKIYPGIPARTALEWAIVAKHAEVVQYLTSLKN